MVYKPFTGRLPNFNLCLKFIFVSIKDTCHYIDVCQIDFFKLVVKHGIEQIVI